jgi:hypothetical protein
MRSEPGDWTLTDVDKAMRPKLRLCTPASDIGVGSQPSPLRLLRPGTSMKGRDVNTKTAVVTDTLLSMIEDITTRILDLGIKSKAWTRDDACLTMDYLRESMAIQMKYGRKHALDPATLAAEAEAVGRIVGRLRLKDVEEDEETPE